MSEQNYTYEVNMVWTGNLGQGTSGYQAYERSYIIGAMGKPDILGTSDPAFRGDASRWSPEEMLLASLSSCHMLWYLHLCAVSKIIVLNYKDRSKGEMSITLDGCGYFKSVCLYPEVEISAESSMDMAKSLHEEAHKKCFIANSVNFPISISPVIKNHKTIVKNL